MVIIFLMLSKNPSLHHPRATFLGLTNEKIVLLSANSIRATVATENNKVQNTALIEKDFMLKFLIFFLSLPPFRLCMFCLTGCTNTKHLKPKESNPMSNLFVASLSLYDNPAFRGDFSFKGRKQYSR